MIFPLSAEERSARLQRMGKAAIWQAVAACCRRKEPALLPRYNSIAPVRRAVDSHRPLP